MDMRSLASSADPTIDENFNKLIVNPVFINIDDFLILQKY